MRQIKTKPNLFLINTPHQLLNAIEAVHTFQLTNNHLLVLLPKSAGRDRFMSLIKAGEWATVSYPSPFIDSRSWAEKFLGPAASRWHWRYLHFQRMHTLARLAARFQQVDKLFLGHYFAEEKPFMRHLANNIQYNTLCLLDDGTDTIEINERRHRSQRSEPEAKIGQNVVRPSVGKRIKTHLRDKYWHWNLAEAPSVTFFTIYDLEVRQSDRLIKNDYSYLRGLAPLQHDPMSDTVIFLGHCVADGYFEINDHLDFLSKAKGYFAGKKIIYVAHPRESASCINQIKEHLQCELWPSSSVIEHDLIVRGIKPQIIAGFVSSALITLAHLMDPDVQIVCFYIAPEHWVGWREDAIGVYNYLKRKEGQRISIVPL